MRVPFPTDWDSESYSCVQIDWPDSDQWRSILLGLITYPGRGAFWRSWPGEPDQPRLIGLDILTRNYPLRDCEGEPIPEPEFPITFGIAEGGGLVVEVGEMGQVVTDVTLEDGVLYVWFGPCCKKALGELRTPTGTGDNPWEPPDNGEPPTYSACGKAYAIVTYAKKLVDAIWDARDDAPWSMLGTITGRFPDVSFNKATLVQAILQAIAVDALYEVADVFDPSTLQEVQCKLYAMFDDDASGEEDHYGDILSTFFSSFGPLIGTLYSLGLQATGDGDVADIIKMGAVDTAQSCECPEYWPPGDWPEYDWFHAFDFRLINPEDEGLTLLLGGVWQAGKGVGGDVDAGNGWNEGGVEWDIITKTGTIEAAYIECTLVQDFDYAEKPKVYHDDGPIVAGTNWPDTDPSAGGTFFNHAYNIGQACTDLQWARWECKGYVPAPRTADRSFWITRIAIAGNGADPFF